MATASRRCTIISAYLCRSADEQGGGGGGKGLDGEEKGKNMDDIRRLERMVLCYFVNCARYKKARPNIFSQAV